MPADDDSALLPSPPPPRPAARETAIAAAMRRFDGIADDHMIDEILLAELDDVAAGCLDRHLCA